MPAPLLRARRTVVRAAMLLAFLPGVAHAHLRFRSSSPAAGDSLAAAPTEIRLRFSTPVEIAVSGVTLLGPAGEVVLGALAPAADSAGVLIAPIVGPLAVGSYTVRWQTANADGHPVRGDFEFVIRDGASGLPPPPAAGPVAPGGAPLPEAHHAAVPAAGSFDAGSPLYAAVRWLTFLGLLGVIGSVAFRLAVLGRMARQPPRIADGFATAAAGRAAGLGAAAAAVLAAAVLLRLGAQSVALHGPADALDRARLATLLRQTVWGWGWLLQAGATAAALTGLLWARRGATAGWTLVALAAVVLAFTPALSGHAAGAGGLAGLAIIADGLHVFGAGGWLGSLLATVAVGVPLALRMEPAARGSTVARLVNAFSPVALTFAGLVVLTGALAAWVQMGSVAALWESGYGRVLLLKLALLSLVFATGAYNWRRVRPALGEERAAGRLRRSAVVELAAGVLVLSVTAVLVATPPPREAAATPVAAAAVR